MFIWELYIWFFLFYLKNILYFEFRIKELNIVIYEILFLNIFYRKINEISRYVVFMSKLGVVGVFLIVKIIYLMKILYIR